VLFGRPGAPLEVSWAALWSFGSASVRRWPLLGRPWGGRSWPKLRFPRFYLGFAQFPGFEASGSDRKTPPILRDPAPIVDLCIKCTELC